MILPYNLIRLDIKGGGQMATVAQIEMVLKRVEQARPAHFFKCMDEVQVGIGAVLRLLYDSDCRKNQRGTGSQYGEGGGTDQENGVKRSDYKRAGHQGCASHNCQADGLRKTGI